MKRRFKYLTGNSDIRPENYKDKQQKILKVLTSSLYVSTYTSGAVASPRNKSLPCHEWYSV